MDFSININMEEELKKEIDNFKKFAFKDNLFKLAIAFILSGVFEKLVKSVSNNLLMPIINYFLSEAGTNWRNYTAIPVPGMTLEIGQLIGSFVDFLITAIILYFIYKKLIEWQLVVEPEKKSIVKVDDNSSNKTV